MICLCKSTRYCNTTCQRNHWKDHKKNCKHLIAERKRKKQLEKEQRERDANGFASTRTVNEEAHSLSLKKEEEVNDSDDGGKGSIAKAELKKEDEGDECPICLEMLPKLITEFTLFTCCGNGAHNHCVKDMKSMKMAGTCPLCRAKTPSSDEEMVKQLRPWVKKKKAWAQAAVKCTEMGCETTRWKVVRTSSKEMLLRQSWFHVRKWFRC